MFNLKKSLIALVAGLALYGLYTIEARADSFVIVDVSGVLSLETSFAGGPPTAPQPPSFSLGGSGLFLFTVETTGADVGNVEARDICLPRGCVPGTVIGTNSTFSGLLSAANNNIVVVNGVTHSIVRVTGSLNFVSPSIVVPDFGLASSGQVIIPFTFSGELIGDAPGKPALFTATLRGQGLATLTFEEITHGFSRIYRISRIEYKFGPVPILIDIKPATFPNSINPKSKGKIPVAILTTDSFDATTVDPATVLFGATGIEVAPVQSATEDVDGDGDVDMILHFVTQDTGITCGNASASLTGAIFSGVRIKGSDSIETVACN